MEPVKNPDSDRIVADLPVPRVMLLSRNLLCAEGNLSSSISILKSHLSRHILLRGNHESRQMTAFFNFRSEWLYKV